MNIDIVDLLIKILLLTNCAYLIYSLNRLNKKVARIEAGSAFLSQAILETSFIDQAVLKSVDQAMLDKIDETYRKIKKDHYDNSN